MAYIKDLKDGDTVEGTYLVKFKALFTGKTGKPYLNIVLVDRSGEISAKVWDNATQMADLFNQNDFIRVRGRINTYQSKLQMVINQLKPIPESEVTIDDFLPTSNKDIDVMWTELNDRAGGIEDPHLRSLCRAILAEGDIADRFKRAPAAKGMHHVFIGGLLEHTLSTLKLVDTVIDHYNSEGYTDINRSLVVAGAILHDLGKIYELSYERAFDYTDEGRLIGHITIGVEVVVDFIREQNDFPPRLEMLLKHLLLSHHGLYEYGSPKRPKTVEAMILHYLDDLDSKVNSLTAQIERDAELEGSWTTYHRLYDRFIYKDHYPDGISEERQAGISDSPERPEAVRPGRSDDSEPAETQQKKKRKKDNQGNLGFL